MQKKNRNVIESVATNNFFFPTVKRRETVNGPDVIE